MIDSHAHLYFDRFDEDRSETIERARENGVTEIINIGIDCDTSRCSIELAREYQGFFAAVGIHPTTELETEPARLEAAAREIRALALENREHVVAIGEIGLDYYWKNVPPQDQKPKLQLQLELARELELPVIFHCRDALGDLFTLLETQPSLPSGGVFHCFGGDATDAERAVGLGFHVSFAGNVTYRNAKELQDAARVVPVERLLLETDAPFLPPQPQRGRRNEPGFLPHTAAFLADLKGVPFDTLVDSTERATRALFGLPARGMDVG